MTTKIITKIGNLLDVTEGHIVHGCNAQGVMGSGVAKAIKEKYPLAFSTYKLAYQDNFLQLGWAQSIKVSDSLIIWNAITQQFFGLPGRNCSYDGIQNAFEYLNGRIENGHHGLDKIKKEIHIPFIGSGLGGGNWNIIKTIIEETVTMPVTLWVLPT